MNRLANLAEKKRRVERERQGRAFQPTGPAVAHLQLLFQNGWTQVEIADRANLGRRTLHGLLKGERPRMNRYTAAAILDLPPAEPPGRVAPTGSVRRVQGLAAIGWPLTQQAPDAGLHVQFLRDLVAGRYRRIPRQHAVAIERLCRLRFLTPGPSKTARTVAARHGWVPVTAWEDIDDPACRPERSGGAA